MDFLKTLVQIVYIAVCAVLTFIVLRQEGKDVGFTGTFTGVTETYWNKNKGRSKEGMLEKATKILAALFIVLSLVLNLNW